MTKINTPILLLVFLSLFIFPSCKPARDKLSNSTATIQATPTTAQTINPEPTPVKEDLSPIQPPKYQNVFITNIAQAPDLYGLSNAIWSPDGTKLASTEVGQIRIWTLQPNTSQDNFELMEIQVLVAPTEGRIGSIIWSLDGNTILGGSNDGVWLWDIEDSKPIQEITHEYGARSFSWSPNGTILASSSNDGKVRLWDAINDWQLTGILVDIPDTVREVAWSPDSTLIATTEKNEIQLWDAEFRELIGTLEGHQDLVGHIAWSPNSTLLASTSDDETVIIWDIETMSVYRILQHGVWVSSIAWSSNGDLIASSAGDGTIRLWSIPENMELLVFQAHPDAVDDLAWNQEDNQLASVSLFEGILKIWQVEFED